MSKLFKNIDKYKNRIAFTDSNNLNYSFKYVLSECKNLNAKVKKHSLILMIVGNNIESAIGYISFIKGKNTTILLDKSFDPNFVNKIINKYKPNYLFCPRKFNTKNKNFKNLLSYGDYILFSTLYKRHKNINRNNSLLLPTSGTTQNPKLVRLSSVNLYNNTKNIINYLKINSKDTTITTMPLGYSYGLSIFNTHVESGSRIVLNNKTIFDKIFWEKVKKFKVNSFGGVPQFYELLEKLKFERINLSNFKYLTQAGGKLDPKTFTYIQNICIKKNINFFTMYGQTEASPRMSYLNASRLSNKNESIGKALAGCSFKLIDKENTYINEPYKIGEIIFYGKNVSLGYANNLKDLTKGDLNKGKLYTGDLGYKDEDGYYYIVGRSNRISKIFGIRVNLDDIEKQLKKMSYNLKCVPDNNYLIIHTKETYDNEKIKEVIFKLYKINKNYIHIFKVKEFIKSSLFKEIKINK